MPPKPADYQVQIRDHDTQSNAGQKSPQFNAHARKQDKDGLCDKDLVFRYVMQNPSASLVDIKTLFRERAVTAIPSDSTIKFWMSLKGGIPRASRDLAKKDARFSPFFPGGQYNHNDDDRPAIVAACWEKINAKTPGEATKPQMATSVIARLLHSKWGQCELLRVEGTDWIVALKSSGVRFRVPPEKRSQFQIVRDTPSSHPEPSVERGKTTKERLPTAATESASIAVENEVKADKKARSEALSPRPGSRTPDDLRAQVESSNTPLGVQGRAIARHFPLKPAQI
jgi:hypothetical protein